MGTYKDGWTVHTVSTGPTITIVASFTRDGKVTRLVRAEKQLPGSEATFNPEAFFASGNVTQKRLALTGRKAS